MQAYLILANGRVFRGVSVGCPGTTIGEVVFATGMVGFEETLTDPSYYGQIITQTYPLIGNYGMNSEDTESGKIWAKGYIVREACKTPSNFRSEETLDAFLKKNGIIGIEGIDTRSLTRTLRESGVMNGAITTEFDPDAEPEKKAALLPEIAAYAVVDAVKTVTCRKAVTYEPTAAGAWGDTPLHVALLDLGCKNNIVRCLQKRGCRVTVLPGTTTAAELAALNPDGLMLSNGLVALSGALLAQFQGAADVNMGRGAIVIGLAAVIIGEVIFGKIFTNFGLTLLAVSIGAIIYYIVLQIVLQLGLNTNDLKLITALIVAVFLAIPYWKSKMFRRKVQPQSAKNGGNGHA